jgi:hypothetical protein
MYFIHTDANGIELWHKLQSIRNEPIKELNVNFSGLPSGIYFYQVTSREGGTFTGKFIMK